MRLSHKAISMRKNLHKTTSYPTQPATVTHTDNNEKLTDLVQEMKGLLEEASADLLQPRPEALAMLMKKVLH